MGGREPRPDEAGARPEPRRVEPAEQRVDVVDDRVERRVVEIRRRVNLQVAEVDLDDGLLHVVQHPLHHGHVDHHGEEPEGHRAHRDRPSAARLRPMLRHAILRMPMSGPCGTRRGTAHDSTGGGRHPSRSTGGGRHPSRSTARLPRFDPRTDYGVRLSATLASPPGSSSRITRRSVRSKCPSSAATCSRNAALIRV